jgi:membrane protein involved in colicin uptake
MKRKLAVTRSKQPAKEQKLKQVEVEEEEPEEEQEDQEDEVEEVNEEPEDDNEENDSDEEAEGESSDSEDEDDAEEDEYIGGVKQPKQSVGVKKVSSLYSKLISAGSVSSKLAKVDAKNPQQVSAPSWKKGKDILGYRYYIIMFAN